MPSRPPPLSFLSTLIFRPGFFHHFLHVLQLLIANFRVPDYSVVFWKFLRSLKPRLLYLRYLISYVKIPGNLPDLLKKPGQSTLGCFFRSKMALQRPKKLRKKPAMRSDIYVAMRSDIYVRKNFTFPTKIQTRNTSV